MALISSSIVECQFADWLLCVARRHSLLVFALHSYSGSVCVHSEIEADLTHLCSMLDRTDVTVW